MSACSITLSAAASAAASFALVQNGQEVLQSPHLVRLCPRGSGECNAFSVRMRVELLIARADGAEKIHIQVKLLRFGAVDRDPPDLAFTGGFVSDRIDEDRAAVGGPHEYAGAV